MHLSKLAAASVLALSVAGCGSSAKTSAVVTGRLDCPDRQGDLTRLSSAPDGKTCVYRIGDDDTEVTLRLIPVVNGDPATTLAQIEDQLKAEVDAAKNAPDAASAGQPRTAAEAAKAASEAQADAAKAGRDADEAEQKADDAEKVWDDKAIEDRVNAKLREKGIAVDGESQGDDESTQVNLPGIHISADGDKADVHVGPIHVDANGDTAIIRSLQPVRMRGEALSRTQRGIRAMFIYAGDRMGRGGGYKYVGYEASGPRTGPLAVAIVKSRTDRGHGDIYGDVKRLVRRNGGT